VELKPCPFCGGKAEFMRYSIGSVGAGCKACAIMFFVSNGNENEAARMWNRRVNDG
jgi:Lar family restriction alleviation protein